MPIIGIHAFIDFFASSSFDLKLHHICIFGIMYYNNYYNVSSIDRFPFLYPLIKTEISSIFYALKYWLPKKTAIYTINNILFYISFLKLRIIDYYFEILYNNQTLNSVIQKYSQSDYVLTCILIAGCYGLYILNLYWFLIINKIWYKSIANSINVNTDNVCHYLTSYIHWLNIPLSVYIYSYSKQTKYIFDVIGITSLSITSYIYHYDIYNRLQNNSIADYLYPIKENVVFFINDNIFIHIRSFLTILTSYYNTQYFLPMIMFSGTFHLVSIYHSILNVIHLLIHEDYIPNNFNNINNVITTIPIGFDIILIFLNSANDDAIPFLLVNIMIGLLLIVQPFYKMTHVGFHILLLGQTYYLCSSHSKS